MEQNHSEQESSPEREPSPHEIAVICGHLIREFVPDADPEDVEENLSNIEDCDNCEEALGVAGTFFAFFDVDPDVGLARLGEVLQVEAILSYGDQARAEEAAAQSEDPN